MALSIKTQRTLDDALGNKSASAELQAAILARSSAPLSPLTQRSVIDMMSSRPAALELLAAVSSGATLSLKTSREIIIALCGDGGALSAGNEFINFVQSVPNSKRIFL